MASFDANFRNAEDKKKFEWFYAKQKIKQIWIINMADFINAKFKYLICFE